MYPELSFMGLPLPNLNPWIDFHNFYVKILFLVIYTLNTEFEIEPLNRAHSLVKIK